MARNVARKYIFLLFAAAIAVIILLLTKMQCGNSDPILVYKPGTTTHDTTTVTDTLRIPFPVVKYVQVAKTDIIKTGKDGKVDTLLITDTLFKDIVIRAVTDTIITNAIQTKYGVLRDTMSIKSTYLFPANTTSFIIKRNDQNIEKLIQTIINSTTVTPIQQMTVWEKLQWAGLGFAAGVVTDRIIR